MSDSVRPHRRQPTRLPRPWDSPGKNTGVGCHFLLPCMKVKSESEVAQSCPTLNDPMDCSLLGSCIHGISKQEYWVVGCHRHVIPNHQKTCLCVIILILQLKRWRLPELSRKARNQTQLWSKCTALPPRTPAQKSQFFPTRCLPQNSPS